jgi:hypothetical protein
MHALIHHIEPVLNSIRLFDHATETLADKEKDHTPAPLSVDDYAIAIARLSIVKNEVPQRGSVRHPLTESFVSLLICRSVVLLPVDVNEQGC